MKLKYMPVFILLIVSMVISKDNEEYVVSNSSHLALYKNRDRNPNEPAAARVSNSEILKVEKKRDSYLFVSTYSGKRGWVKKWLVKPMNVNVTLNKKQEIKQLTLAKSGKQNQLDCNVSKQN